MAFFKDKKKEESKNSIIKKSTTLGSKISRCMVINGNIISCEAIVVDGRVNGDIISSKSVVLNRGSIVVGKIKAKEVSVEGILEGPIEARVINIGKSAITEGYMIGENIVIAGECDGDILAKENLLIEESANVTTLETKAKTIKVSGVLRGDVLATEFLIINKSGLVDGNIKTKEYFRSGNSKVTGTISRFVGNISNKGKNIVKNHLIKEKKEKKFKEFGRLKKI
jgi:cytoskeletal protein CcmA (bactofilin family)